MKAEKTKKRSFRFKLWTYFAVFTAVVFLLLWLLQTVFLQGFYNSMIIRNAKKAANRIAEKSNESDVSDTLLRTARKNSLLFYIVDEDGSLLNSADEFRNERDRFREGPGPWQEGEIPQDGEPPQDDKTIPVGEPPQGNGFPQGDFPGEGDNPRAGDRNRGNNWFGRDIPLRYKSFAQEALESESGTVEYREEGLFIYGRTIEYYGHSGKAVLLTVTTIDAVGSSVHIIRVQLLWVTVLSLLLSFALSWFMARKFAGPVGVLSEKATKLGESDYSEEYPQGFCTELDNLSDTLDRTNEKLVVSKNFQNELLANVSHDLRTPLTMIKGYAEMITDISLDDREQCYDDMKVIVKESDRLTALVNEILTYSELQNADKLDDSTAVDLSSLAHSAVESFATLGKAEGITVETEIDNDVLVSGSRSHLERALYNLMDNAVRHTGENKTIRVSLHTRDGFAVLSVTDFGAGIPKEELARIWDRYHTARQRKGKGVSGLGLAIVKQIVNMHRGRCEVVSEQGKGSTFSVLLPLLSEE